MARINVEDSLYKDRRFFQLMMKLGDLDKAVGCLVRAWVVAQKWYLTPERMIPMEDWEKQALPKEIIEVGLAEVVGGKVRVSGADEQFGWLVQKVEAGRKGGAAPRNYHLPVEETAKRQAARLMLSKAVKTGKIIRPPHCSECKTTGPVEGHHDNYDRPYDVAWLCRKCHREYHRRIDEAYAQHPLSNAEHTVAEPKPPTLSPSPSLSPSRSSNSEKKELLGVVVSEPPSRATWLAYATAWSKRHGGTPLRDRQANAQLKKFVERVGQADGPAIAAFYVTHNDAFYVKNRHPINLLLAQCERIRADWQAGRPITQGEARQTEVKQGIVNGFGALIAEAEAKDGKR